MLCCFSPSTAGIDPTSNTTGVSLFPGQRRPLTQQPNSNASAPAATLMVTVVIPPGMAPGQTIRVQAPDASRTVNAIIPQGLEAGQTFFVTFPPPSDAGSTTADNQSNHSGAGSNPHSPADNFAEPVGPAPVEAPAVSPAVAPVMPPTSTGSSNQSTVPFSQVLDGPPPNMSQQASASAAMGPLPTNNTTDQKLLLVNVPPGSEPGSTLYVSVPGENRTLAATVPHGVTQFHVAYQPRTTAAATGTTPIPAPAPLPSTNPLPTFNDNGQKLLLVRVPPGTAPGTTLHVTVPDEPGRVLAAEVPPHTSEFQVAYIPRAIQQQQSQSQPQQQSYGQYRNSNAGMMNRSGGMRRMNNAMLPLFGGAALGAAGVSMFDHYHHHGGGYHQQQDYSNQDAGYNDYGGDYGGYGDYGGGDFGGGGGGDFGGGF